MGVTGLWDILKDAKSVITIEEMAGQTLAVDLAVWVCEADGVKPMHDHVQKPYLRNLFFRVAAVVKAGIKLIFVLDGKAPDLKLETISKRLAERGGGKCASGVRRRLNARFNECCRLLDSLGVPWIKAEGEAEAFCAALNKHGLVDAVITNDGDCFLYGACTVYRNFSIDKKENSVDRYLMDDIEKTLNLNQRGLIALGLLLGCDYCPKGVAGVGSVQAVKLLSSISGQDPIDLFKSWREQSVTKLAGSGSRKKVTCQLCACKASKKNKDVHGCKCYCHVEDMKRMQNALEERVKTLALKDPRFPDSDIIKEFLTTKRYEGQGNCTDLSIDHRLERRFIGRPPVFDIACQYLVHCLAWTLSYAIEKVLPIVSLYHLRALHSNAPNDETKTRTQIQLEGILKRRIKDRIPSVEVQWKVLNCSSDFIEEEDIKFVTVESEANIEKAYPNLIAEFFKNKEQEKERKKKEKIEERKLQRKKKGGEQKPKSDGAKKVTEFFEKKPSESRTAPQVKIGETSLDELGLSLASLSLQQGQSKTKTTKYATGALCPIKTNAGCDFGSVNPPTSKSASDGKTLTGNLMSKNSKVNLDVSCELNKDVTFSEQLDFSLGFFDKSSIMLTPSGKENTPHHTKPCMDSILCEKSKANYRSQKEPPTGSSNLYVTTEDGNPCTPQKPLRNDLAVEVAGSPVFMTLMERIKLRAKSEG